MKIESEVTDFQHALHLFGKGYFQLFFSFLMCWPEHRKKNDENFDSFTQIYDVQYWRILSCVGDVLPLKVHCRFWESPEGVSLGLSLKMTDPVGCPCGAFFWNGGSGDSQWRGGGDPKFLIWFALRTTCASWPARGVCPASLSTASVLVVATRRWLCTGSFSQ